MPFGVGGLLIQILISISFSLVLCCVLDIDFRAKEIDEWTYENWRSISLLDRIPYLLDDFQIANIKNDYFSLCFQDGSHLFSLANNVNNDFVIS